MAGSFTSPSGATAKMKVGKVNRPKRTSEPGKPHKHPAHPITDSHASSSLPHFHERHANTNNKHGFHTTPGRPPAGRLAHRPDEPSRGSGHEHRSKG